jgi:ParB family transcriptional regulator, chromosome partitioning protein
MKAERVGVNLSGLDQFKASALLLADPVADGAPKRVPLGLIDFDPKQPRRKLDADALAELAETIKQHGVLEPVSLRPHPEHAGRFIVNRGERRVRASLLAKVADVPAFIDERVDPYAQVIENEQREDLSLCDLATFVAEREAEGDSRAEIARRLGKSRSLVTELASLQDAPPALREACAAGRIVESRALYLVARAAKDQSEAVASLLAGDGQITRAAVERALSPSPAPAALNGNDAQGSAAARDKQRATQRAEAPKKLGNAFLVEYEGRKGRLSWAKQPGKRSGEVLFEDGTRKVVGLASLTLIAWTTR